MKKMIDVVSGFIEFSCKIMLIIQVVSVMTVIIGRYFFNTTPVWSEELTLFCLVWLSLAGAMLPLREKTHIRLSAYDDKLSLRTLTIMNIGSDLVILFYSIVMIFVGFQQTSEVWKSILHGMKISKGYLYASVPISMILFALVIIENNYFRIKSLKKGDSK